MSYCTHIPPSFVSILILLEIALEGGCNITNRDRIRAVSILILLEIALEVLVHD